LDSHPTIIRRLEQTWKRGTREESDSHGFGEDGVPVLEIFRSREENAVSVGGNFMRFD